MRRTLPLVVAAQLVAGCGDSVLPENRDGPIAPLAPQPPAQVSVVDGGATRLLVLHRPLTLVFTDAEQRIALVGLPEFPSSAPSPEPFIAVAQPAPLGAELPAPPPAFSFMAYAVGSQQHPQIPAGPWEANVLTGAAAGVAYHVTGLTRIAPRERGLALELATNDPSGRTIHMDLQPAGNGGIRVRTRVTPGDNVAAASAVFLGADADSFRGFGGRHNALDQRGNDFLGWVQQQNTGAGMLQPLADLVPGGGGPHYLFPNGKTAAYYIAPSFTSERYSFLLERDELSRWRMGSDLESLWQVQVAGAALDYSVVAGPPKATIAALTQLTGRHRPPPDWVTGVLIDRATIAFTQTPAQYEAQVRDDLAQIDALGIRLSGYRVEGWFELAPDIRAELAREFHRRGIKVLAYFRAFVAPDTAGTEDPAIFQDAIASGYVTTTVAGTPYVFGGNFFGPSALIDFTQDAAVAWWKARIQAALDEGVDGFMQDFGEQTMSDMQFADGRNGAQLHNRYLVLYHRATREAIDEWLLSHPGHDDIWFFTRAGYAGLDGSAGYEGANFAGDGNTDFSVSSGLAAQTPDMLSRGIGGAYGFTTDIGGYFDYVSPATTKELFIRWAQWAALSPLMRVHGSVNAGTHMPWHYDDETLAIWRTLSALRYRAQPYIQRLWREAHATGMPIARPLWLEYPGDAQAAAQDQQWLLGADVLVAPVVTEGATAREVYFPAGCWRHAETGAAFDGPITASVAAPLGSLPYFFRCGSNPF